MGCSRYNEPAVVLARFAVCPKHGPIATPPEPAPDASPFRRLVLEHLPFPIAYGYQRTDAPESATAGIQSLAFT